MFDRLKRAWYQAGVARNLELIAKEEMRYLSPKQLTDFACTYAAKYEYAIDCARIDKLDQRTVAIEIFMHEYELALERVIAEDEREFA